MIHDFTTFSEENFNSELAQVDWESIFTRTQGNIDTAYSKIYNELTKLVNKHSPLKQLSKPWITKGTLKYIKIKNALFSSGHIDKYKITLIRHTKKFYYHT